MSGPAGPDLAKSAGGRPPLLTRLRRTWPWLRYVVGLGLGALAVWALLGRRDELSGASAYLSHLVVPWLVFAAILELASIVAFAIVQQELLAAGDVVAPSGWITAVTLAATAIANSMPAGPLVSSVFAFRQYRRRGADDTLAGWTLAAVFVAASVSLALVAVAGLAVAAGEGASLDLVGVTVVVAVVAVAMGALFVQQRAVDWVVGVSLRTSRRLVHWPSGDSEARIQHIVARIHAVTPKPARVVRVLLWAVLNWLFDCGCLALCFRAVGVGVPWHGLLLAYGAGQLAANLPVTPGGLGVVEGSLTIALVAFGGAEASTVAAVLMYRIMSFWAELPLGWGIWAAFAWQDRRDPIPAAHPKGGEDVAEVLA